MTLLNPSWQRICLGAGSASAGQWKCSTDVRIYPDAAHPATLETGRPCRPDAAPDVEPGPTWRRPVAYCAGWRWRVVRGFQWAGFSPRPGRVERTIRTGRQCGEIHSLSRNWLATACFPRAWAIRLVHLTDAPARQTILALEAGQNDTDARTAAMLAAKGFNAGSVGHFVIVDARVATGRMSIRRVEEDAHVEAAG